MYRRLSLKPMIITMSSLMIVAIIGIVYAVFTGQLNISGTAVNRASSWDVHFENLSSVTATQTAKVLSQPSLASATSIANYSVSTTTPGDSISFTFDVKNSGNYNAKITSVNVSTPSCTGTDTTSNTNVCSHLSYTITYANGASIQTNDIIYAKDKVSMKVTLTYSDTVLASELATSDVSISNLGITINFEQSGAALVKDNGEVANYTVYHQGDKITLNEEDYYIIADSGADKDYVTALKDLPLTVSEVNTYGSSIPVTATNQTGYGGIAYGEDNTYANSYVKIVIDEWAEENFTNSELAMIDQYSARLITQEQYNAISNTYNWRSIYNYWTMTMTGSEIKIVDSAGAIYGVPISRTFIVIRPVINVYKSALETNNNE